MIKINYKNEIEEYLKKELELCKKILSYNEQIEKYTKNGENKKADEVLKKSIEKTKELGLNHRFFKESKLNLLKKLLSILKTPLKFQRPVKRYKKIKQNFQLPKKLFPTCLTLEKKK